MDVDALLQEIEEDNPCGEDLEYDEEVGALERASAFKPEQQVGDSVIPAEEPDWREVGNLAEALFSRTKDLRIAMHLVRARLRTDGFLGLAEALAVVQGMIERYWEEMHPRLDPDDDNDPTLRVNLIAALCDPESMLRGIREAPLVSSRAVGRFGLRDLAIARGETSPPADAEEAPPSLELVEAAFTDVGVETIQETTAEVAQAREALASIESELTDKVGAGNSTSLEPLVHVLGEAAAALGEQLARLGAGGGEDGTAEEGGAEAGAGGAAGARPIAGEIGSREDVIRLLDKMCRWYERVEPASPVPILLNRARRLVPMNFWDIINDIAPSGRSEVEVLRGPEEENDEE